jgi:hypothetical protein
MALPSPKEVRRCGENNGGDERKNHLFRLKESKIWKTLTLSRSEHAHTHNGDKCLFFMGAHANFLNNF